MSQSTLGSRGVWQGSATVGEQRGPGGRPGEGPGGWRVWPESDSPVVRSDRRIPMGELPRSAYLRSWLRCPVANETVMVIAYRTNVSEWPTGRKAGAVCQPQAWPDGTAVVQQAVGQLRWGHVVALLQRLDDRKTREFYAARAAQGGWSRAVLEHHISTGLHRRVGRAPSNFATTIPCRPAGFGTRAGRRPLPARFARRGGGADRTRPGGPARPPGDRLRRRHRRRASATSAASTGWS